MKSELNLKSRPTVLLGGMTEYTGGKEAFIMSLFRSLQPVADCVFLADRPHIAYEKEILAEGGAIEHVCARGDNPLRFVRDLRALFARRRFDAVWMNQTVVNSLEPLLIGKLSGCPIRILHSHNSANAARRLTGFLHFLQRPLVPLVANRRLACSNEAGNWFYPVGKWSFLPNAFDVERFSFSIGGRERVRRELGIDNETIVISHVARLGPAKNHQFVVDIAAELKSRGVPFEILLVGDGPFRDEIEERVKRDGLAREVRFLGVRKDVPDVLSASDLGILPSTFEGLPYTVLEAQANALPILVSDAVSQQSAQSDFVSFLPLSVGAKGWADQIEHIARMERAYSENPLVGGEFDLNHARDVFREIALSGATQGR